MAGEMAPRGAPAGSVGGGVGGGGRSVGGGDSVGDGHPAYGEPYSTFGSLSVSGQWRPMDANGGVDASTSDWAGGGGGASVAPLPPSLVEMTRAWRATHAVLGWATFVLGSANVVMGLLALLLPVIFWAHALVLSLVLALTAALLSGLRVGRGGRPSRSGGDGGDRGSSCVAV